MKKQFFIAICLLAAFVLWTITIGLVDVQAIGPNGSSVGFSTLNGCIHRLTGVHMTLYVLTDWLGLVPFCVALCFAVLCLMQWIKRKQLSKVDFSILALGGFYLAVIAAYLFFEQCVVNYRPVLIDGFLEASYPSSTTMLVMCVIPTAVMQTNARIKNDLLRRCIAVVLIAFTVFMVIGRLISGVHWFTDIVGGALFSAGMVTLYDAICRLHPKE